MNETKPTMTTPPQGGGAEWTGFLIVTIIVVGLCGLFTSYAAPLPFQRALAIEQVMDKLTTLPASDLPKYRDALGDSAHAILDGSGPLAARIAAERPVMEARLAHEGAAVAARLRLLLCVVTALACLFGAVLMRVQRRA